MTTPRYDHGDHNWTFYGYNNPYPVGAGGGYPPDPTCVECDGDLADYDPDEPQMCAECRHEIALLKADDNARRLWNHAHGFPEDGSLR